MVNLATMLVGPLVGPECRRALARGWIIVVRVLAGSVLLAVAAAGWWWWWVNTGIDPFFRPYGTLRGSLTAIEWLAMVLALVMSPALLGGSLAGERERGALGLLLTTRVRAFEIVVGRLVGKLTQVAMVLLAGLPAVVLLAASAGFHLPAQLLLLVLPFAVAFGGGGLALAASSIARRGRDALLAVYVGVILLLLAPLLSATNLPAWLADALATLNPFVGILPLAWGEDPRPALASIAAWTLLGAAGTALATWRVRPSCLGPDGGRQPTKRSRRRWRVPSLDERPMLWKELYIERAGSLGRFGRWLSWLFILLIGGGGLTLAAIYVASLTVFRSQEWELWALGILSRTAGAGPFLIALIQVAIGLRAAVAISSERERGTWDAILTSPLDGKEIVAAKLRGCLEALNGLLAATLVAWTAALIAGAVRPGVYATWIVDLLVVGLYMAAVGVRTSLEAPTATKAMALTVGIWLASWVAVAMLSGILIGIVLTVWFFALEAGTWLGLGTAAGFPTFPIPWAVGWPLTTNTLFLLATALIISDTALRFDRIAGRMTEGRTAIAVERLLYGPPNAPLFVDARGEVIDAKPEGAVAGPA